MNEKIRNICQMFKNIGDDINIYNEYYPKKIIMFYQLSLLVLIKLSINLNKSLCNLMSI